MNNLLIINNLQQRLRAREKELKKEKLAEIEMLKSRWTSEKEKLEGLVRDDGNLEKKILNVYKQFA